MINSAISLRSTRSTRRRSPGGTPSGTAVPSTAAGPRSSTSPRRSPRSQRSGSSPPSAAIPSSGEGRIAGSTWRPVPEPAFASMPPRGQAWEAARYRAYQAQVTDRTMGDLRPGRSSQTGGPRASLPSPTPAARLDAETLPVARGTVCCIASPCACQGLGRLSGSPGSDAVIYPRAAVPVSPSGAVG
jgi:hypothetical protein